MAEPDKDALVGRLIDGRYQIDSRIARGGMATVYLATDLRLERQVAVKIMHDHLAGDAAFRNRFIQEARSAARLAHPNVVSVFDQGQDSDMAYLVMEYLPGMTLRDLLRDFERLNADQTCDVMDAVLRGLSAAHEAGIVHRDLKPENVLLADDGRIKIGDFGLARATTANTASGQALLGTIAYLSPELLTRGVADARSDIYAAGIMMFEMLTGQQPFTGEQPMQVAYQHANDKVPLPSSLRDDVPSGLDDLVAWATQKDPDKRPKNAAALRDQLIAVERSIRGDGPGLSTQQTMIMPATSVREDDKTTRVISRRGETGESPVASLAMATQRRRRRGLWIVITVILAALLAGATGWYFGAGPGALVTVPRTAKLTPEQATTMLSNEGFSVTKQDAYSLDIPPGQVIDTKPAGGSQAQRGSTIAILVSLGPKMVPVPTLVGESETTALELVKKAGFVSGTSVKKFAGDVAAGTVMAAHDKNGENLPDTFPEGAQVILVVSAGPLPDVTGLPQAEALAALEDVGLKPVVAGEEFSDTIDKGSAIRIDVPEQGLSPGDTANVVISKGPDLVDVPDVTGYTIQEAMDTLRGLGFVVTTNVAVVDYWNQLVVKSQSVVGPAKRGSTVRISNPAE